MYNINASNNPLPKDLLEAPLKSTPYEPTPHKVFLSENSPSSNDLTNLSLIEQNLVPDSFNQGSYNRAQKRRIKQLHRFGFLMKEYDIKSVSMLTFTVVFDGNYKTAYEYDKALSRIRRIFHYYGISKITGSEFTEKGVKHYHTLFDRNSIIKICSSKSFKRFVKSYKFTDDDFKAIFSKKRSYLEIYIARWFAKKWKLGFCDLLLEAKALYLIKYVSKEYNDGKRSLHGRIFYSREYSKWFNRVCSLVEVGFNNRVYRYFPKFYFPIFLIKGLPQQNRLEYLQLQRRVALYRFYQSRIDYLRSRKHLTISELKQLDYYAERLGLLLGY